jgi:hypothetical protein
MDQPIEVCFAMYLELLHFQARALLVGWRMQVADRRRLSD